MTTGSREEKPTASQVRTTIQRLVETGRFVSLPTRWESFSGGIVCRIADDYTLGERIILLREHVIVGSAATEPGWKESLQKQLDDWTCRVGVATVTLVLPSKIAAALGEISSEGNIRLATLEEAHTRPLQELLAPPEGILSTPKQVVPETGKAASPNEAKVAALRFLARMHSNEEPLLDPLGTAEKLERQHGFGNVRTQVGGFDVSIRAGGQLYLQFWRLRISRLGQHAALLSTRVPAQARPKGSSDVPITEALQSARAYSRAVLSGADIGDAAHDLQLALSKIDDEGVIASITHSLLEPGNTDLLEKRSLIGSLAALRAESALPCLERLAASPDREVRRWSVAAMAGLRGRAVVRRLAKALSDRNNLVRSAAISGLSMPGSNEAARTLVEHLSVATSHDRRHVLSSLAGTGVELAFQILLHELLQPRHSADLRWPLTRMLRHDFGRRSARTAWSSIPTAERERALAVLRDGASSTDDTVSALIEIVSAVQETTAIPILLSIVSRDDEVLQYSAAQAIVEIGGPEASMGLLSILESQKENTHWSVLRVLGTLREERAVPSLVALLAADTRAASEALDALAEIRNDESISEIVKAAHSGPLTAKARRTLTKLEEEKRRKPIETSAFRRREGLGVSWRQGYGITWASSG